MDEVSIGLIVQSVSTLLVLIALLISLSQSRALVRQNKTMSTELSDSVYDSLMTAHISLRSTFFKDDPELLAWHLQSRGYRSTTDVDNRKRLYALVKLDLHEAIFLRHHAGAISLPVFEAWTEVLRADVGTPTFVDVWANGHRFYETTFQAHVDRMTSDLAANSPTI